MKLIDGHVPVIELTRRNLTVLLAKLDDPDSHRLLVCHKDGYEVAGVRAVEDDVHYADREPGPMDVNGVII